MRIFSYQGKHLPSLEVPGIWSDWLLVPLVLLLSAFTVMAAVTAYFMMGDHYTQKTALGWPGGALQILSGKGGVADTSIEITRLDSQGLAALRLPVRGLDASAYGSIRVETSELTPATRLGLLWREDTTPGSTHTRWLSTSSRGTQELALFDQPQWRGRIDALVLLVEGAPPDPLTIHRVELRPHAPTASLILGKVWSEWTTFGGWTGRSINFIVGGKRTPLISPVLAAALWVTLSITLYAGTIRARRRPWRLAPFAVLFLAGWMALDMRWQRDLLLQLQITKEQYAGKTGEGKRLAAEDRTLFLFAEEVKRVLPREPVRLFLVAPSLSDPQDYYRRVRLHYLLLPHNIGSLWTLPPSPGINPGDYILILPPHPAIRYFAQPGELRWDPDQRLPAERLISSPTGSLFRVR